MIIFDITLLKNRRHKYEVKLLKKLYRFDESHIIYHPEKDKKKAISFEKCRLWCEDNIL